MTPLIRSFTLLVLALSSSSFEAQDMPPSPKSATPETEKTQGKPVQEKETQKKEQSQRVMGVLPQFGVTNRQDAPPLTNREKFHLFTRSAFDPGSLTVVGIQAGVSQANNEFPSYGQGAQGYGKRFGAALADEVSASFFSSYFYPVLLKHDPRYFRLGRGGFTHRFFYGIKQEFVSHTDKGGRSFNFSNTLGAFSSGAVSNIYYPSADRGQA